MFDHPIVILGGGINGAAAARELALEGANVWLVDTADLAFGATAYSSRLIHGGLRYLEFAEFSLVRESLEERARLLRLAPQLVRPLRLFIPVKSRWGGLWTSAARFLGLPLASKQAAPRGLHVVQIGLALYDFYSQHGGLPPRSLHSVGDAGAPRIDPAAARWLWAYSDAQITYPERLVVDLLHDARALAAQRGTEFRVFTYSRATLTGKRLEIRPEGEPGADPIATAEPAAIINATGAWVDATLARLPVASRRLMGGTKGSHFLTFHQPLAELLGGRGIYTEARDGRPVFLLPLGAGTLVGTTDIPFSGDPATAVATEAELDYLLGVVAKVFPAAGLRREHLAMHQCGVRPLPYVDVSTPAAITRRHLLVWNPAAPRPLVSLVGGKLTTCRSLAEETAAAVLHRLGRKPLKTSRDRPIPAAPIDAWLHDAQAGGTPPSAALAEVIRGEWVTRLEDLVERRLMLHLRPGLTRQRLTELATALAAAGKLDAAAIPAAVERCAARLQGHFGRCPADA